VFDLLCGSGGLILFSWSHLVEPAVWFRLPKHAKNRTPLFLHARRRQGERAFASVPAVETASEALRWRKIGESWLLNCVARWNTYQTRVRS
jgi:hypothetical protein